jgi:hypothetical protein
MDQGIVRSLTDLDEAMAFMHPKPYFLRGLEIFQRGFGTETQQSDRGLEEDDPGLGSPYRSSEFYEGIDGDWGYGGRSRIRGFSS